MSEFDLAKLAFAFGQYLNGVPGDQACASEACQFVYQQVRDAQDLLKGCEKLKGYLAKFSYVTMYRVVNLLPLRRDEL